MSFMPSPGSLVRMNDGLLAVVTRVSPKGDNDWVQRFGFNTEDKVTAWDILSVLHEIEASGHTAGEET